MIRLGYAHLFTIISIGETETEKLAVLPRLLSNSPAPGRLLSAGTLELGFRVSKCIYPPKL